MGVQDKIISSLFEKHTTAPQFKDLLCISHNHRSPLGFRLNYDAR